MLNIIYGKDRESGRERFRALLNQQILNQQVSRPGRRPLGAEVRHVLEGEINKEFFDMAVSSQGLFGEKTLFIFDCVLDKKNEQETLLFYAKDLSSSSNIFLIFEPLLESSIADSLKEEEALIEEYALGKTSTRNDFNIFSLGDALGQRNKKELWVLYQEALRADLSAEEICGTLFWMVKNLALMKNAKLGNDRGMSPFVAKKTRAFTKNYTEEEIAKLSQALTVAYHEAHRGGEPMEIALERFILAL